MAQIICDTWKEAKGFIMQYPELIGQVMLKSEGKNIVDIYDPNHTKDWTTLISQEKLIQIVNSIENVLEPSIKTGSNDVYKELLSDPRWILKRDEIKRRDASICTKCYNGIILNDISELRPYLRSERDFEKIKELFPYKPTNLDSKELNKTDHIVPHGYIPSIGLWIYDIIHTPKCIYDEYYKGILFSNKEILTDNCKWTFSVYNTINPTTSDYKGINRNLYWQYCESGNTDNKLILSHCVSMDKTPYFPKDYRGIGILTYNQYSIIFPLFQLNTVKLEVHHKVYKKENGEFIKPWEYKDDELETLCHSCHEQTHLEENIKIIHNNHF